MQAVGEAFEGLHLSFSEVIPVIACVEAEVGELQHVNLTFVRGPRNSIVTSVPLSSA